MAMLQLRDVRYTYQTQYQKVEALKGISHSFESGKVHAIVGRSGEASMMVNTQNVVLFNASKRYTKPPNTKRANSGDIKEAKNAKTRPTKSAATGRGKKNSGSFKNSLLSTSFRIGQNNPPKAVKNVLPLNRDFKLRLMMMLAIATSKRPATQSLSIKVGCAQSVRNTP